MSARGEVTVLTPVAVEEVPVLRGLLRRLHERRPRVFAGLGTHFARFAVVECEGRPQLLFSAVFDGPEELYLGALAARPQAQEVYGHCEAPRPCNQETLRAHLLSPRARRRPNYVVSMLPAGLRVAEVNRALATRRSVSALALESPRLDGIDLAQRFAELPAVRMARGA